VGPGAGSGAGSGAGRAPEGPPEARHSARFKSARLPRCSPLPHLRAFRPHGVAKMSLSNKLTLDKLDVKGKRVVMR
jgi:hypothetical protein